MKKKLLLTSVALLSTGIAFAKNVDFDTVIKWNSEVISAALTKAGFIATSNAAFDVRKTHERILNELVKKQSFSLRQATQVCLDKCNMSDMLKNGRGQSGKKCPELCTGFVDALISVNNEFTKTKNITAGNEGLVVKQADGTLKIYSADKKYYAICSHGSQVQSLAKKYSNICKYDSEYVAINDAGVVFETKANKPIALLGMYYGDGPEIINICSVTEYDQINFRLTGDCNESDGLIVENTYLENFRKIEASIQEAINKCHSVNLLGQTLIDKYVNEREYRTFYEETMQEVQICKNKIAEWKSMGFTENSWNRSRELNEIYWRFDVIVTGVLTADISQLETGLQKQIDKIKQKNGKTFDYSYLQFRTPEEAFKDAKSVISNDLEKYRNYGRFIDTNKIKCSGKCNHIPGTNDTVTCTIGDVTYKVIYDDICQTKLENALGNFFDRL